MRIAFIGTEIPDYCIEVAAMMAESCDVLLCIPDRYHTPNRIAPNPRLRVEWLPWPRKRDLSNIMFTRALLSRINAWKPDVVHFLCESNVWNWLLAGWLKPMPIVTTVHDVRVHPGDAQSSRIPRVFANALIRRSDKIIVHGESLRNDALGLLPVRPDQVEVMPLVSNLAPGPNVTKAATLGRAAKADDGQFRILFFGRIYEYKGLRFLLEAMPVIREKVGDVRLIVAGEGEDMSKYGDYIADRTCVEIRNRFISREEMVELFTDADVLALPYIEASQSGPLMIAMTFGLPVVATDVGELANVVRSTDMGLVVSPRDSAGLANAICRLALDKDLRARLARNAAQATEGEFSRTRISNALARIYRELTKCRCSVNETT